jgi:diguanylate cyclase (GGDEF)-like protein
MDAKREITSIGVSPEEARRAQEVSGIGSYALILVRVDEEITGTLGVFRFAGRRGGDAAPGLSQLDVQTLRKLALFVSLATEFARAGVAGGARATKDPLTGLLASAGFEARVQDEVKRAERYRERFLLTLCTVRDYEELKERLGPGWADAFLREFSATLAKNVREVDAVARITDGRFAVLSPAADKDSGALLKRLETLLPQLQCVRSLAHPSEVHLAGRQYTFPDEVPTGGELLALVRSGA